MSEAVRVKSKMQWKPQDMGNVRNMDCLLRKATGNKWSQHQRGHMRHKLQDHGKGAP
jgi:hypothetical protein